MLIFSEIQFSTATSTRTTAPMYPKKIMLLAGNFCGNLGDIFIFESVVEFIIQQFPDAQIDVYPYPIRHDHFVSLPIAIKHKKSVTFKEPIYRLRGSVDALMREHPLLERTISKHYFKPFLKIVRSDIPEKTLPKYDHLVIVGGEMDIPYSQLDVHAYIRKNTNLSSNITYGPVSIPNVPRYHDFLKQRFSEVKHAAIRDPLSLERLNSMGIHNVSLVPDCAFLNFSDKNLRCNEPLKNHIGVCLHTRWGYIPQLDEYVNNIIEAASKNQSKLHFFCTHPREDATLMKRLSYMLQGTKDVEISVPSSTLDLHNIYNSVDMVISDRLHGILIGLLSGCNILPLATRDKVKGYCTYLGLKEQLTGDENATEISDEIQTIRTNHLQLRNQHAEFMQTASTEVKTYYLNSINNSLE